MADIYHNLPLELRRQIRGHFDVEKSRIFQGDPTKIVAMLVRAGSASRAQREYALFRCAPSTIPALLTLGGEPFTPAERATILIRCEASDMVQVATHLAPLSPHEQGIAQYKCPADDIPAMIPLLTTINRTKIIQRCPPAQLPQLLQTGIPFTTEDYTDFLLRAAPETLHTILSHIPAPIAVHQDIYIKRANVIPPNLVISADQLASIFVFVSSTDMVHLVRNTHLSEAQFEVALMIASSDTLLDIVAHWCTDHELTARQRGILCDRTETNVIETLPYLGEDLDPYIMWALWRCAPAEVADLAQYFPTTVDELVCKVALTKCLPTDITRLYPLLPVKTTSVTQLALMRCPAADVPQVLSQTPRPSVAVRDIAFAMADPADIPNLARLYPITSAHQAQTVALLCGQDQLGELPQILRAHMRVIRDIVSVRQGGASGALEEREVAMLQCSPDELGAYCAHRDLNRLERLILVCRIAPATILAHIDTPYFMSSTAPSSRLTLLCRIQGGTLPQLQHDRLTVEEYQALLVRGSPQTAVALASRIILTRTNWLLAIARCMGTDMIPLAIAGTQQPIDSCTEIIAATPNTDLPRLLAHIVGSLSPVDFFQLLCRFPPATSLPLVLAFTQYTHLWTVATSFLFICRTANVGDVALFSPTPLSLDDLIILVAKSSPEWICDLLDGRDDISLTLAGCAILRCSPEHIPRLCASLPAPIVTHYRELMLRRCDMGGPLVDLVSLLAPLTAHELEFTIERVTVDEIPTLFQFSMITPRELEVVSLLRCAPNQCTHMHYDVSEMTMLRCSPETVTALLNRATMQTPHLRRIAQARCPDEDLQRLSRAMGEQTVAEKYHFLNARHIANHRRDAPRVDPVVHVARVNALEKRARQLLVLLDDMISDARAAAQVAQHDREAVVATQTFAGRAADSRDAAAAQRAAHFATLAEQHHTELARSERDRFADIRERLTGVLDELRALDQSLGDNLLAATQTRSAIYDQIQHDM